MLADSAAFSGFAVPDTDAARQFYSGVLGLDVTDGDMPGLIQLNIAGDHRVLIYPKPDHTPATYTILNFPVDDVAATVKELTDKGVEFLQYDGSGQDELGVMRGHGPTIAWFTDPAGNILSVLGSS